MAAIQKITPFLWFDTQAEEAAKYYVGIFKNSKIEKISRYGEGGKDVHKRPPGSVMVVEFILEGQRFTRAQRRARTSSSTKPSPSISGARTRGRSTTTGISSSRAATRRRSNAAGSRTSMGCPGRWRRRAFDRLAGRPLGPGGAAGDGSDDGDEEDRRRKAGRGSRGSGHYGLI